MAEPLSEERWQLLVESLRHNDSLNAAAKMARCDWRTAKHAYDDGANGRRPIREILAQEQTIRRALVSEEAEELKAERTAAVLELEQKAAALEARIVAAGHTLEQQSAQLEKLAASHVDTAKRARARLLEAGGLDAAQEYKREGMIARALQSFTQARIGLAMVGMRPDVIENLGRVIVEAGTRRDLDLATALRLANHLGRDAKAIAELAALSQDVTRKWLGAPTQITSVEHTVTFDPNEFEAKLRDLQRIRDQLAEHDVPDEVEADIVEELPALLPPAPAEPAGSAEPPAAAESAVDGRMVHDAMPLDEALAQAEAHWRERDRTP